jgi:hypothetical protein
MSCRRRQVQSADLNFGNYAVGRKIFVDIAFRQQITSLIESEETQMIVTELYWSYSKINFV